LKANDEEVNMRILVTPERLDDLSRQMTQAANELRDLEGRLGRALGSLDWEARQQANVEARVNAARRQAQNLAGEAEELARFLTDRAAAFRQADAQGAESLGATTQAYLRAARSILPQLDNLLAYMGAGRVATQKFLDLVGIHRYGSLAPWLKIGVLDQRYKFSRAVGAVGMGVGIAADILTADEINERTIGVAVIRNVGEYRIGAAVPHVAVALAGNAVVQLAGTGIVMANRAAIPLVATSKAMADDLGTSTDRLEAAFQRIDLSRITKDISEIVYDATIGPRINAIKAAWQEPNITNLGRLFMAINPAMPVVVTTPEETQTVWNDVTKLAGDTFDLLTGIPDLFFTAAQHGTVMTTAVVSKTVSLLPISDEWKTSVQHTCEYVIDYSVSHPVTIDSFVSGLLDARVTITSPIPLVGYPSGTSLANSLQFTPVLVTA
jgi:hypothetical protein